MTTKNKEIIETLINTTAIAFTATGTQQAISGNYAGLLLVLFGVGLEWFKYYGRKKELW